MGLENSLNGDAATALKLFLKAYELKPNDPKYALSAANMLLKCGDNTPAIALYKEVLRHPSKLRLKQQCMAESKIAKARRGCASGRCLSPLTPPLPLRMRKFDVEAEMV